MQKDKWFCQPAASGLEQFSANPPNCPADGLVLGSGSGPVRVHIRVGVRVPARPGANVTVNDAGSSSGSLLGGASVAVLTNLLVLVGRVMGGVGWGGGMG